MRIADLLLDYPLRRLILLPIVLLVLSLHGCRKSGEWFISASEIPPAFRMRGGDDVKWVWFFWPLFAQEAARKGQSFVEN
jgi:hypothetical protein